MTHQWAVIGGGPAGIAAVGKLIDKGVIAEDIVWIDPQFRVGDFGTRWGNVPSNTKVDLFLKFLHAIDAFDYKNCQHPFALNQAKRTDTCHLRLMSEPLQWVTDHLKQKVCAIQGFAEKLTFKNRAWHIQTKNANLHAKNVILAIGAEPKNLAYPAPTTISLHDAMDAERLKACVTTEDTVAVFGSSHSAVLILRHLVEIGVKQIINFYLQPLVYAVYLDDWILFDDTGLKGTVAEWSRQHIDDELPANLKRIYGSEDNIEHYLPQCNKVIYAVGFERRTLPVIEGLGRVDYMHQTGIIAPGLFGFGIAFPEAKYNRLGILEYRVGLWKFMDYLERIMPVWLKYGP